MVISPLLNGEFRQRPLSPTHTDRKWFFCKIRQWFRLNFWASRFYKSKDTKLYEFSSVKIVKEENALLPVGLRLFSVYAVPS